MAKPREVKLEQVVRWLELRTSKEWEERIRQLARQEAEKAIRRWLKAMAKGY